MKPANKGQTGVNDDIYFISKVSNANDLRRDKISQKTRHREMKSLAYNDVIEDNLIKLSGSKLRPNVNGRQSSEVGTYNQNKNSRQILHNNKKADLFPPLKRRF